MHHLGRRSSIWSVAPAYLCVSRSDLAAIASVAAPICLLWTCKSHRFAEPPERPHCDEREPRKESLSSRAPIGQLTKWSWRAEGKPSQLTASNCASYISDSPRFRFNALGGSSVSKRSGISVTDLGPAGLCAPAMTSFLDRLVLWITALPC